MLALPGRFLVGTTPAALYVKADAGWQEVKGVWTGAVGGTFPPNPDFPARTRVLSTNMICQPNVSCEAKYSSQDLAEAASTGKRFI